MKISPTFLTRLPFQVWEMNFVAGFCTYNVLPLFAGSPMQMSEFHSARLTSSASTRGHRM